MDIVGLSNQAYRAALAATAPVSPPGRLPALLGLCLMDSQVVDLIRDFPNLPNNQPTPRVTRFLDKTMLPEILDEFAIQIDSPAWNLVRSYVKQTEFRRAAFLLMEGKDNPWNEDGNTIEQMIFWAQDATLKGEHVVP